MLEPRIYNVTQINRYIRKILEQDFILSSLFIKGEISNFKKTTNGHLYFTLKDAQSAIQCVMFQGNAKFLSFLPENGMLVLLCGSVSLYEKIGQYQFYAELLEPVGAGALNIAFEQLKARLEKEGLFDHSYKKEIPKYPKKIVLITSPTGAAVRDMIQIIRRRNKGVEIVVVPVLVQGEKAADTIVSALKMVNKWNQADVILLGRGGGSLEDLWPFNEEKVARAIFSSHIPIISAVGHETDVTIADFAADLRAPTPSAAAELAVSDCADIEYRLEQWEKRIGRAIKRKLEGEEKRLSKLIMRPVLKKYQEKIDAQKNLLQKLESSLNREQTRYLYQRKEILKHIIVRLEQASPMAVIKRGFVCIYKEDGALLTSAKELKPKEKVKLAFKDGNAIARIEKVWDGNGEEKTEF